MRALRFVLCVVFLLKFSPFFNKTSEMAGIIGTRVTAKLPLVKALTLYKLNYTVTNRLKMDTIYQHLPRIFINRVNMLHHHIATNHQNRIVIL